MNTPILAYVSELCSLTGTFFASLFEFSITLCMNYCLPAFEHITWRYVAYRAVKTMIVVMTHEFFDCTLGILKA